MTVLVIFVILLSISACAPQTITKPTPLISGITLDVEPYTRSDWDETHANKFVDLLAQVKAKIATSPYNVEFAACVPSFFETMYLQRNSVNKTLLEFIIDETDRIVVMAYRDWAQGARNLATDPTYNGRTDSVLEISKEELQYGKPNGVEIIVETIDLGETPHLTFHQESTTYMEQQLAILETSASQHTSYYGKGIHYYPPWKTMGPQYSVDSSDCSLKRSMFAWEDQTVVNNATYRQEMLNFIKTHGVSSLIFSTYPTINWAGQTTQFKQVLREIYEQTGVSVQALFGDADWALNPTFALNVVQTTLDFIAESASYGIPAPDIICNDKELDTQIPKSFTIDFLAYLDPNWETNTTALANEFLDNVQAARSLIQNQSADVQLSVNSPFWYNEIQVPRSGQTRPLSEWLIDSVDRLVIVPSRSWANGTRYNIARTDSIEFLIQEEMAYAASVNKKVAILLNVRADENNLLTFRNENSSYLENEITKLHQIYANNDAFDGVILNDQLEWSNINPSYSLGRRPDNVKSVYVNPQSNFAGFTSSHAVTGVVVGIDTSLVVPTNTWSNLRTFHRNAFQNKLSVEWFWENQNWAKAANQADLLKHMQLAVDWTNSIPNPTAAYLYDGSIDSTITTGNSGSNGGSSNSQGGGSTVSTSTHNSAITDISQTDQNNNGNKLEEPASTKSNNNTGAIVGGVLGCIALTIIVLFIVRRRRNNNNHNNNNAKNNDLELAKDSSAVSVNNNNGTTIDPATNYDALPSNRNRQDSFSPTSQSNLLNPSPSHFDSAVSLYSNTKSSGGSIPGAHSGTSSSVGSRMALKSDWKIDYNSINIEKEIGRGAYGIVFKGKWRATPVAVKRVVTENMSQKDFDDFHHEVELMKNLRPNPNIVILLGVCDNPLSIVTEFYGNGSLFDLISSSKEITPETKVKITIGIARGMLHLHMENIIHRDLAARNVLLGTDFEPKISDFGLSRVTEGNEGGKTNSNVGPLLWMAPECINDAAYSAASDVWAFGVTVIELYTRQRPYEATGFSSLHIASSVMRHELKPTIPVDVPKPIMQVLQGCFEFEASHRPDFAAICTKFEKEL